MRGADFQPPTAFAVAVIDCAASTVSAACSVFDGVFHFVFPSVGCGASGSVVESEIVLLLLRRLIPRALIGLLVLKLMQRQ
jgi:hypothetical protein